jgi:hypothetical protein
MKILKKIKSLLPSFSQKKTERLSLSQIILERIQERKSNLKKCPKGLSTQQWLDSLNKMSFAFSIKTEASDLKSPARKKQRERKIKDSLQLFEEYLKEL